MRIVYNSNVHSNKQATFLLHATTSINFPLLKVTPTPTSLIPLLPFPPHLRLRLRLPPPHLLVHTPHLHLTWLRRPFSLGAPSLLSDLSGRLIARPGVSAGGVVRVGYPPGGRGGVRLRGSLSDGREVDDAL